MSQARPELGEVGLQATPPRRHAGSGIGLTLVAGMLLTALVGGAMFLRSERQGPPVTTAPSSTASPSVSPTQDVQAVRDAALTELLAARSKALLARDRDGWMATVDAASTDFADRQALVFDNLAQVPLRSWGYDLAGNGPGLASTRLVALGADDAWVARVVLEYRLTQADQADVRREQYLTVVDRDGRWLLADDRDGETAVDLWDLGPVQVVRGERSLLLGITDEKLLKHYSGEVDAAALRVDAIWGTTWPRTVVVMVPADQGQLAALLAREDQKGLDQIAAVTTGELGLERSSTSADRVIINPQGFAQLQELGRDVVLTHEITHVATRGTTAGDVPIWLSEGFADYLAYSGKGLKPGAIARDVLDLVREGTGPTRLPDARDFDPTISNIAPAYSGAWLACRLIAETYDEPTLVEFYRTVAGGGPGGSSNQTPASTPDAAPASQAAVDAAFRTVLATDEAAFTQAWLEYLDKLAR